MRDELHKCPSCNGTEIHVGYVGPPGMVPIFKLSVDTLLSFGNSVPLEAFVCLSCGYVGHFVSMEDLQKLRAKVEKIERKQEI